MDWLTFWILGSVKVIWAQQTLDEPPGIFEHLSKHGCCSNLNQFQGNSCSNRQNEETTPTKLLHLQTACNTTKIPMSFSDFSRSLHPNGGFSYSDSIYTKEDYCVYSFTETLVEVVLIQQSSCRGSVRKCCNAGETFDIGYNQCLGSSEPRTYYESWLNFPRTHGFPEQNRKECTKLENFTSIKCWSNKVRYSLKLSPDVTQSSTLLHYEQKAGVFVRGNWKILESPFCLEQISNYASICSESTESHAPEIVFYCADAQEIPPEFYAGTLGLLWIATSALLLITAILNVTCVQKNSHGWVLSCYLMTSAFLNLTAGIFMLVEDDGKTGCNFLDFATKFLYSSTLCWMTMVNFDLWWTFRKLENVKTHKAKKSLPYYVLFAWSIPTGITSTCWFVGSASRRKDPEAGFDLYCVLFDHSVHIYSSGPIVFLILVNLCLFIRTAVTIQQIRTATKQVLRESRVQRESFKLFSKLFLMSGPIWILRVILLGLQFEGKYLTWYGVLIEVIFSVPDIVFFLLIILHPKIIKRDTHFPWLRRVSTWFHDNSVVIARNSMSLQDASVSVRRKVGVRESIDAV